MLRLLLVRHGETDWNREGRYHGHTDIELNDTGIEQARKLAQRLQAEPINAVYSSDLKRALKTAELIASSRGLAVTITPELRELHLGYFEGKRFRGPHDEGRPLESAWESGNIDFDIRGGESLRQLQQRVARFIDGLTQHYQEGTVLLVSHGGTLRMMICNLIGLDISKWWRIRLDSGSLSIIHMLPERNVLMLMNDICHTTS